ncbi:kinase-like protein [Suillus brevipes Sb2]|nr:kinase-like protein [Suillus brevipes Sb2]
MRRELQVWFRLRHSTIVPLLGIAYVESPLPALVSQWMPLGTLDIYLEKQATALTASTKVALAKSIADGLIYLHSENVVHGDLQPPQINVLVDSSGNPRLTGFGIATVVGDPELQLATTTADRSFDSRWRAPELIGVDCDPETPTFESDVYSFGSVMFYIISGDIPWKEKKRSHQISIELSRGATPARPENILNDRWNLIQRCWSWNPGDRPLAARIIEYIDQSRNDDSQV